MSVVVVAEVEAGKLSPATLECVGEARALADALGAAVRVVLPGRAVAALADEPAAQGADQITLIEHADLAHFSADGWLEALEAPLREINPAVLLAPDSGRVRAWLPRLALRWGRPLVTGCTQVRLNSGGELELTRPYHSGLQQERMTCPRETAVMATLLPGARGQDPPREGAPAAVERVAPALDRAAWRDQTVRRLPAAADTVDIGEAERIVAGGLGLGSAENVALLHALARPLKAAIAGTRVISDRGWIAHERYIGSTGKTVSPRLYIALGISGASQHTVGMASSEHIIAVNIDRTAPIFGLADLGIVGDLHKIVPILLERLESSS